MSLRTDWAPFAYQGINTNDLALVGVGRNGDIGSDGKGFFYDPPSYGLYETDINLAALGLDGKVLQSITFTEASAPDPFDITGIFGVSGVAVSPAEVPEPGTLTLVSLGVLGLLSYGWRRQKAMGRG